MQQSSDDDSLNSTTGNNFWITGCQFLAVNQKDYATCKNHFGRHSPQPGSAIAHRAVGTVAGSFGGGSNEQAQAPAVDTQGAMPAAQSVGQPDVCAMDKQMFYECLGQNKGEQQACQFLYNQLKQFQQSATHFG